jgi:hypothetical protein
MAHPPLEHVDSRVTDEKDYHVTRLTLLSLLMLLAVGAGPAFAQMAYKSTMPDGRVIYGDKPEPGARKVEQISVAAPRTSPDAPAGDSRGEEGSSRDQARVKQQEEAARARSAEREQRQQRVREAEQTLKLAEDAKRSGEEPLPGERIGTAGGGSRLTDQYFERQKQLEQRVEDARRELDEARNAAR